MDKFEGDMAKLRGWMFDLVVATGKVDMVIVWGIGQVGKAGEWGQVGSANGWDVGSGIV